MDTNKSAFPLHDAGHGSAFDKGMTLRDYFAAKAMQGWLVETSEGVSVTAVARFAYEVADAMMKAREA